jgi:hypothetical protein
MGMFPEIRGGLGSVLHPVISPVPLVVGEHEGKRAAFRNFQFKGGGWGNSK